MNGYGVDDDYFRKKLESVIASLYNYTSEELSRELYRLANTAGQGWIYHPPIVKDIFDKAEEALAAVKAEQESTPFALAIFDGEGGYDFVEYEGNENYKAKYIAKNGEKYADWVAPLYKKNEGQEAPELSDEEPANKGVKE